MVDTRLNGSGNYQKDLLIQMITEHKSFQTERQQQYQHII